MMLCYFEFNCIPFTDMTDLHLVFSDTEKKEKKTQKVIASPERIKNSH